jgi:hypothetical protein
VLATGVLQLADGHKSDTVVAVRFLAPRVVRSLRTGLGHSAP